MLAAGGTVWEGDGTARRENLTGAKWLVGALEFCSLVSFPGGSLLKAGVV